MDTLINPRAITGDNHPPIEERLAIDHADLVRRANEAADLVPDALRPIETEEEADAYTETAKTIKEVLADADAAFTPEKEPWLTGGRKVDAFFGFRATLKTKAAKAVAALNAWQTAKLAAQRKADADAAEKARRVAALFDEPAPVIAPTVTKEAARVVTSTGAKATASTYWKGDVTDIDKVPRQYMMVNQAAIDAAIKGGVREIAGVHIHEAVRTSIRR
jgi:hypothetical protein